MLEKIDDTVCPFCKSKNQCMAHIEEPCWCNNTGVSRELRALAPKETQGKVCICHDCIQSFTDDPIKFKKHLNNPHV